MILDDAQFSLSLNGSQGKNRTGETLRLTRGGSLALAHPGLISFHASGVTDAARKANPPKVRSAFIPSGMRRVALCVQPTLLCYGRGTIDNCV